MRFSIGTDDFKKIRTDKDEYDQLAFYCDKSLMIQDVINGNAEIVVLPRPRRFGKTLNLSMLRYFFDAAEDNRALFQGLKIADNQNIMDNWQGKYPVVFISFKALRADNVVDFVLGLKIHITDCYKKHAYLLDSDKLSELDKNTIRPYFDKNFDNDLLSLSLKYLTQMLAKHYGKNAIVLIDEYDSPLITAYMKGFFKDAINPYRDVLGEVLKGNDFLYKGVVTGITRIAKESLFSGVNNLRVYDITANRYAQYFGFTDQEVQAVCPPQHLDSLKSWYNGYTFGDGLTIYNPWSVLNFLDGDYKLIPYWINTSGNDLIRDTLTADKLESVKTLIEGGSISVEIEPFTVLDNLKTNPTSFWNLLFLSGYLTLNPNKNLRIPNQEIRYFFEKIVMDWFGSKAESSFMKELFDDLIKGYQQSLQEKLSQLILETFSFHDVTERRQESFYHGFLLGISLGLKGRYTVKSNRESGYGRYDIALYPNNPAKDPGIIFEVKFDKNPQMALEQMQDLAYATELRQHGCQKIYLYGMTFDGKVVDVQMTQAAI